MEKKKMLNAERFKEEINKYNNEFGLTDSIADCKTLECRNCRFSRLNNSDDEIIFCSTRKVKWLLSEYKEPVKLTELEHGILEYLLEKRQYRFVVRERSGIIYVYKSKPKKEADSWGSLSLNNELGLFNNLFQFVQWQDSEPTSIEYVLNNCEVIDGD